MSDSAISDLGRVYIWNLGSTPLSLSFVRFVSHISANVTATNTSLCLWSQKSYKHSIRVLTALPGADEGLPAC